MIFSAQKLPEDAEPAEISAAYNTLVDKLTVVLANIDTDNLSEELLNEKSGG